MRFFVLFLLVVLGTCRPGSLSGSSEADYGRLREQMVATQLQARDIHDPRVLAATRKVPRHLFMPELVQAYAYEDTPLPIGEGQTISQPYMVALMTQVARPEPEDRALEIGTGSGYQAAVLAEIVSEVYSIEIVPKLARRSRQLLRELDYSNLFVREGDGYRGWPEKAPFDIILITAAAPRVPKPLTDQLTEGGRLVLPMGAVGAVQVLTLITKKEGRLERATITGVRFVPMTGRIQRE